MLLLFLGVLSVAAFFAIRWGLSPYFTWKRLSEKPVDETFTIVTKDGRESLADYLRNRQREVNQIDYTLIVPSYNEERRLPNMLPKTIQHFEKMNHSFEIIVVNDASKDATTQTALKYSEYNGKKVDIKVLEYKVNQGKGGAVRTGVIASSGNAILMVDADGASEVSEVEKLIKKLKEIEKDGYGFAVGSRRVVDENTTQERFGIRLFLSGISNFIVQNICGVKINDTQCGFKLFTRKTADTMFRTLHIRRWAFDVELFVIANELGVPYAELPIVYCDQDESKLNVVTDSIQMARDYILIKLFYVLKLWKKDHTDKIWEAFRPSSVEKGSPSRSPKRAKRD